MTDILNRPTATETRPDWGHAMNAVLADTTDLSSELRRLTPKYLDARAAFEETGYPHGDADYEYSQAGEALVHVLVAIGAYETDIEAHEAVQSLTYPGGASMLVERWAHREGLDLSSGEISRLAKAVEDRMTAGGGLADLPMWMLAVQMIAEDAAGVLAAVGDGVDAGDVPDSVMESVVESLMDDRESLSFDELPELARGLLADWAEERR
jgi:hypothetical protein